MGRSFLEPLHDVADSPVLVRDAKEGSFLACLQPFNLLHVMQCHANATVQRASFRSSQLEAAKSTLEVALVGAIATVELRSLHSKFNRVESLLPSLTSRRDALGLSDHEDLSDSRG